MLGRDFIVHQKNCLSFLGQQYPEEKSIAACTEWMIIIQTTREMRSVCNNDEKRERENQTCQQWPQNGYKKSLFIIHFWRNNFHIHLKASFSYFSCFIFILCIQLYENVFNYINMYSIKTKCIQLKQNVSNYNKMNSIASKMYSNTSRCFWYNFLSSLLGHCDCCDKGHDL